ncbi:MAG: TolC family protein [Cellulosilyticum sp.]|nr:TolC family protein [Cellulosilyticum sp.]
MKLRRKLAQAIAIAAIGIMSVTTSFASELPVLTLEQAISSALSADAAQQEAYTADRAAASQIMQDTDDVATTAYQSNYYNRLESEQTEKYHKDAVTYEATKLYNSIALLEKQVAFCDEKLVLQEKQFSQAELKYRNGLISKIQYETAESTIKEQRTAKDKLQAELDKNRADFKLLAKYDTSRYTLEGNFDVEYYEYTGNIQYFFNTSVNEMLQYQEKLVEVSENYSVTDALKRRDNSAVTYYNSKSSTAQAKVQLKSMKEQYLSSLNTLYSSLETTKQNIKELEVKVQDLEKTLEANKLKLEKGLISQIEVDEAELDLKELQLNLLAYKVQYNATKDAVKKPWVNFY